MCFRWAEALLLLVSLNFAAGWWVGAPALVNHHAAPACTRHGDIVSVRRTKGPLQLKCQQYSLYNEQEKLIVERGRIEGELMPGSVPLAANIPKLKPGLGAGGGFGGGKKSKKAIADEMKAVAQSHAAVLKKEGVVRIDNVISTQTADSLRSWVMDLRAKAEEEVRSGAIGHCYRFADVLLKTNRCDLTMPISEPLVLTALTEALCQNSIGGVIQTALGDQSPLYELSCLISDPGSQRQVVHPDTPYGALGGIAEDDPVLYTCFVALQDVRPDMGPTIWLPGTHTKDAYERFAKKGPESKDELLNTRPSVLGLLPKGCSAIFDSRLLHAGGSNQSPSDSRALFYFTFKNPKVGNAGNPGSIRPELIGKITLASLVKELNVRTDTGSSEKLDELAALLH